MSRLKWVRRLTGRRKYRGKTGQPQRAALMGDRRLKKIRPHLLLSIVVIVVPIPKRSAESNLPIPFSPTFAFLSPFSRRKIGNTACNRKGGGEMNRRRSLFRGREKRVSPPPPSSFSFVTENAGSRREKRRGRDEDFPCKQEED